MSLQEACGCVCVCVPVPARGMRVCVVCNIYPRFQEARCPCKRCVGVGGVCVCVSLSLQEACGCVWVCNIYPRFQEAWGLPEKHRRARCPCKRHVGVCGVCVGV